MKCSGRSLRGAGALPFVLLACAGSPLLAQPVPPPVNPPEKEPVDRPEPAAPAPEPEAKLFKVKVSRFVLSYARPNDSLPPIEEMQNVEVRLSKVDGVYTAPTPDAPVETIRLGDWVSEQGEEFDRTALNAVSSAIRDELTRRGLIAHFTVPHPEDISEEEPPVDLRENRTDLRYQIFVGVVSDVRTIASGDRLARRDKETGKRAIALTENNPKHTRIRNRSPVKAGDLLNGPKLENYLYRLSRHPGRSVEMAVSAGDEPNDVVLDYMVSEEKPWSIYGQLSNTGTRSTGEWRERAGFIHNQLTGHDDIFRFDYITAEFDDYNAYTASYEFPVYSDRLRAKVYGLWSEYTASDVGIQDQVFEGEGTRFGGELSWNIFQKKKLFIDVFGGARWENEQLRDVPATSTPEGDENFFVPSVGVRVLRDSYSTPTYGQVWLEWNWADLAGTDQADLANFRRDDLDASWTVLKWEFEQSFYLEPLLNRRAWRGEPDASKKFRTLAHEISFSFRGQDALGNRLIPTEQTVLGGAFTVRGYPESAVAGDSMMVGSVEYRFHVPRVFSPRPAGKGIMGKTFQWAPTQEYGAADWDLILRGFCDVGQTTITDARTFELEHTLSSVGIGAELQLRRNVTIRADWGFVLNGIEDGTLIVSDGDNRVHFVATLLF
jgi:hypothetical protein